MTALYAQLNDNWDATNQWNTAANGSGSYQTPGASDTCYNNGKTVTVNVDINVTEVTANVTGGGFVVPSSLSGTRNIVANIGRAYGTYGALFSVAHTAPNIVNITGNLLNSGDGGCLSITGSGTTNITGNLTCNSSTTTNTTKSAGGTGTLNITGNLATSSSRVAFSVTASGDINITGNVSGGTAGVGLYMNSTGTVTIIGAVTGGSLEGGYGVHNASTATIALQSTAIVTAGTVSAGLASTGTGLVTGIGRGVSVGGVFPFFGKVYFPKPLDANFYVEIRNSSGDLLKLRQKNDSDYPNAADVRYGTDFRTGDTGTLRVPGASDVRHGVLVDATEGTANLDPADFWGYETRTLTSGGGATPQEVWEYSTRTITAGGLTQADVRSAVGLASANLDTQIGDLPTNSELSTALAGADDVVLAAISALNNLSSAGAQAAAVAALTAYAAARTSDVPSAAANASQVRVELATELARLDASSSSISTSTITSLKAMVADGTITFEGLLKLLVADQVGKVTNAETSAPVVWDTTGTIARKTATNADEYGNRSGVVVDLE